MAEKVVPGPRAEIGPSRNIEGNHMSNIPNDSSGPDDFRSASNFFGSRVENDLEGAIAANPLQLHRGSYQVCMPTARYLDMTVGLVSGITLSRHRKVLCNRTWAGPATHQSRKRRKLS